MTEKDLAPSLAKKLNIDHDLALRAIQETFYIIEETMKNEDKSVTITNFGTFALAARKERFFTNPVTKERTLLPACQAPVFRYTQRIKDEIKEKTKK